MNLFRVLIVSTLFYLISMPISARCAVCVVQGMSGASIAVLVILSAFIFLFFANWVLKKYLDKANN
tara:strand:- start:563 stop:760 length:198 start_codon:yes stop_codon:yes gene_type:complete